MSGGWIGVDFDGTLATYDAWRGSSHTGEPIAPMIERVKAWLAEGREVRIFTARVWPHALISPDWNVSVISGADKERLFESTGSALAVQQWCQKHIGRILPITCVKDYGMIELWDDRAVQVRMNTGEPVGESTRGL